MARLIANKRMTYPRGLGAVEYKAGEEFDCDNERDIKALTLVRAASLVPQAPAKPSPPAKAKAKPEPIPEPDDGLTIPLYLRRDMRPEE